MTTSPADADVLDELAGAAADLEAATTELDARSRLVDRLEATLDTILDDPTSRFASWMRISACGR
jgi:hypothetical protein